MTMEWDATSTDSGATAWRVTTEIIRDGGNEISQRRTEPISTSSGADFRVPWIPALYLDWKDSLQTAASYLIFNQRIQLANYI